MFSKIEWIIANRYLKTKRKESFITIISWLSLVGITLGVAVLIIVMSVMNGFKRDLIKSIVGIDGHLSVSSFQGEYLDNYNSLINIITKNSEVKSVGASINTQGLITTKYYSSGVMVKGLSLEDIYNRSIEINSKSKNAMQEFQDSNKVVIMGYSLARSMGVSVGDEVKVVFPEFMSTAFGSMPRYLTLKLIATFKTGMFQYDSNMIIMPLGIVKQVFTSKGVQQLEIFINNPDNADIIKETIEKQIGRRLFVNTWKDNNLTLITALDTERNVMFIILFLIIMVATFNIMSGLIMLVRSKTKEIAILKTMGFNNKNVQNVFLLIGLRTGIIGTISGTLAGVLFSLNIERIREFIQSIFHINLFNENVYFLSRLPAEVSFLEVGIIALSSILLSITASIYPARKASKVIVAKALHYE